MSKVLMPLRHLRLCLLAMMPIALMLLSGCGGGDAAAAPPPPANNNPPPTGNPPPEEPVAIEGVATPSSVAVVTATNAQ